MGTRTILIMNVDEPYRMELANAAAAVDLDAIEADGELSEYTDPTGVALAVLGWDEDRADPFEPLRVLRKVADDIPTIVLARRMRPESAFELSRFGVSRLVMLPAPADRVADRCLVHAIPASADEVPGLIGSSPQIGDLRRLVVSAAASSATILLTGETGVGKGLVARAVHSLSSRRDNAFVHTDCSALSPSLIESELFGHEPGAFTGAVSRRAGRLEQADEGTLFLDEIGELDRSLQSKFLRALEDREYERVGGGTTRRLTARVIAASNRSLKQEVAEGRFRSDLFFRLKVVHLHLPSLKERISDVPVLVEATLDRLARELQIPRPSVATEFIDRLMVHAWPGNVRELIHVLEAVLVRTRATHLELCHLSGILPSGSHPWSTAESTARTDGGPVASAREGGYRDREQLLELLTATGGNVARVARRLGIPRSTVRYRIRRHGLTRHIPKD